MGMPYCVPYFDGACNTLARFRPLRRSGAQVDLQRLRKFSPAAQVFALWGDSRLARPALFRVLMHRTERELAMNADIARLCRSAADARTAAEEDRVAVFLSVEGAEMLGCSVAGLAEAYRRGIRSVAPVWDFDNALCGAARDGGGGLTEAGERFVRAAGELGMAIDLSHSSERAFWDVIRLGGGGVWCSNSDARGVCDHPRNLTDAQIEALIRAEGCVGLNLNREFLGGSGLEAVTAQVEYFLGLGAGEILCLGTGFDGIDCPPEGIGGVEDMDELYEALLRRNLREELVQDIFYHNLLRFMERAL